MSPRPKRFAALLFFFSSGLVLPIFSYSVLLSPLLPPSTPSLSATRRTSDPPRYLTLSFVTIGDTALAWSFSCFLYDFQVSALSPVFITHFSSRRFRILSRFLQSVILILPSCSLLFSFTVCSLLPYDVPLLCTCLLLKSALLCFFHSSFSISHTLKTRTFPRLFFFSVILHGLPILLLLRTISSLTRTLAISVMCVSSATCSVGIRFLASSDPSANVWLRLGMTLFDVDFSFVLCSFLLLYKRLLFCFASPRHPVRSCLSLPRVKYPT